MKEVMYTTLQEFNGATADANQLDASLCNLAIEFYKFGKTLKGITQKLPRILKRSSK